MKPFSLAALFALAAGVSALDGYTVPEYSPGYQHGNSTQAVQFDKESLYVDGQRIFLYSGEFHPFRLPVPQLWSDILQKMKAAGFNAVSIYIHWGLTEGKRGYLNWDYYRSLELFYQVAQEVGIYVVARPGPYINAETTGGGLPGWLTNSPATARTNGTDYIASWQSYVRQFSSVTSHYQYPDGPVIAVQAENEFYTSFSGDPTATDYMAILTAAFRTEGIDHIPLDCNDVWPSGHFASGPGQVDIYGFDAYPGGFDCTNPSTWEEVPTYFTSALESVDPWGLMWIAEFQGGSLDAWGGSGYEACYELLNANFTNVFYKNNLAEGAKAMSIYMIYGGTNWGNLAYPGVYTSYDYGAAIHESRLLSDKYSEIKLQGLFYQSSPSLYSTDVYASATGAPYTNNTGIYTTQLRANGSSPGENYYVVRQISNNFTAPIQFSLSVTTAKGQLNIPQYGGQITLAGRESKTLVTQYPFGQHGVLNYSTAEVLTQTSIDSYDYLVLYVSYGQTFEASVHGGSNGTPSVTGSSSVKAKVVDGSVIITGIPSGISVVRWGSTVVIVTDKSTAYTFWDTQTHAGYLSPTASSVLIQGPYLVRNASVSGSTLNLVGDTNGTTPLTVFGPSNLSKITWNGASVSVSKSALGVGLSGTIQTKTPTISLPSLKSSQWKSHDSLPEISPSFDDSTWVTADLTNTTNPTQPTGGKLLLYADAYGFHSGSFIYRGYFNGTATAVNLTVDGGSSSNYSIYLNGHFLASGEGYVAFPSGVVSKGTNVLTVITDSNGLDEDWNANDAFKDPRGIQGYELVGGGDFYTWKLTGNYLGEDYPDKVRGPINEGGFWAERVGAALPGYPDSTWNSSTPYVGISSAGAQVYRTSFNLAIPKGVDAPLALQFTPTPTSSYRAWIYINGWQYGKFVSNLGPQTEFPIPEGILNYSGSNELAIILWALDPTGAKIADLELVSYGVLESGREVVTGPVYSPGYAQLRG